MLANVLSLFMAPPKPGPRTLPLVSHCLALLRSELLLLRQLGGAGLWLAAAGVVEGAPDPGVAALVEQVGVGTRVWRGGVWMRILFFSHISSVAFVRGSATCRV